MDLRSNYPGIGDDIQMIEGNGIAYGKSTDLYKDENFPDDCQPINSSTCDGSDDLINYNGIAVKSYRYNLRYYVYYSNIDYTTCELPAFIVAHPGGFSDCSYLNNNSNDPIRILCIEMAKRGYVCFSIEYRRGRIKKSGFITVQQMLSYYRACQDFRGAVRSIITKQRTGSTTYKIDENQIFVGGISAGSFAALNAAYINQSMMEDILPGITNAMGSLDIDLYTGGASISNPPTIKGVMNCWGNFYIPLVGFSDIPGYFLSKGITYFPPAICFQGLKDKVAFPHTQPGIFPPFGSSFRTDNCLTNNLGIPSYTLPLPPPNGDPNLYACGAEIVFNILRDSRINIACEIYEDSSMAHGINDADDDFSFQNTAQPAPDVYTYIAQRTATYFQAVRLGGALLLGHNFFLDCANARHAAQVSSDTCGLLKTTPF
ncbi:MAG: hypothetical protein JST21_06100 [Bacteroidetes bacterium]|nr:hypothetical protein [Bacteroidota bacterium]